MDAMEITTRRMRHQRLWAERLPGPADVVGWLGAVQAQEFIPATWGVAQRCEAATAADLAKAFDEGAILRTHVLRPTWHFVRRQDIVWLLALTAPRVNVLNGHMYRSLGLDEEAFLRCNSLLVEALRGGEHLTRKELAAWLDRRGLPGQGLHLVYLLMRAELDAVICSGARKAKQQTYALVAERAPDSRSLPPDAALAELTRRFFVSRAAATLDDYTRWSSLTKAQARAGLEMVAGEVEAVDVEGRTYIVAPGGAAEAPASPRVDLVQGYDECLVSYGASRDVLVSQLPDPPAATDRPTHLHVVLLDGRLIGRWKHTMQRSGLVVDTMFHRTLAGDEIPAMDEAAGRLGAYFGVRVTWR
jgi:hypothetical protein